MEIQDRRAGRVTTFYVNGEALITEQHKLQVREILTLAGLTPPEQYRLIRVNGNKECENLDEEIPVHNDEKFTALFRGETPVSGSDRNDQRRP